MAEPRERLRQRALSSVVKPVGCRASVDASCRAWMADTCGGLLQMLTARAVQHFW